MLEPEHFAFYNCGRDAGSSREHKHVQVLVRPGPLFPDNRDFDRETVPFRFFLRYLDGFDGADPKDVKEKLSAVYSELLKQARDALGVKEGEDCPHNVVIVKDWILVIPRRSNDVEGVTANSAGMMGYVWLGDRGQLENWERVGVWRALEGLGVPR